VEVIERLAADSPAERQAARERAANSALVRLSNPLALEENRSLFASL